MERGVDIERAKQIERMQVVDWLRNNLETAYTEIANILQEGSVYNKDIYQSLFNKIYKWLQLKKRMAEGLEAELFDVPPEDKQWVSPEIFKEVGSYQEEIKNIRDSLTDDEIIVLKTLTSANNGQSHQESQKISN